MSLPRKTRLIVLGAALAAMAWAAPAGQAQLNWSPRGSPFLLLGTFIDRCEAMSVDRDTGAEIYHVYAFAVWDRRLEPLKGDSPRLFSRLEVCIFDRSECLASAKQQYRALQTAFRRYGGAARYRDFPFEDRSWQFDDFPSAEEKVRQLKRKSWMSYWPGVLNLRIEEGTEAPAFFIFGYRPIYVQAWAERDEEDGDLSFAATKGAWRLVIFDDEEVALVAKGLYEQYVSSYAPLTDGKGNRVGQIVPYLEKVSSFAQARQRADQLRRKMNWPSGLP